MIDIDELMRKQNLCEHRNVIKVDAVVIDHYFQCQDCLKISTLSIISHISSRLLNRAWSSLIKTLRYSRSISSITTFLIAIFSPLRWGGGHGYKF